MLAVDCCRNMETNNYNGRESEDTVPNSMGAERGSQVQEDRSPLLEVDLAVDPQVQPEFGQAIQPEASDSIVVEAQDSTKQLQIAGASFLVTLKEKYKVQIMHEIHLLFFSLHASDHPVCRRLC